MRRVIVGVGFLGLLAALAACGGGETSEPAPPPSGGGGVVARPEPALLLPAGVNTPTPLPTVASLAIEMAPGTYEEVEITRAQFSDQWPFTIESGIAHCIHRDRMPVFRVGDEQFALTGRRKFGYPDIDPILMDDPINPGSKMSVLPIANFAVQTCDPSKVVSAQWP